MAYDYLGLVNELCRKVNEVELTSSNFTTAVAWYAVARDAINRSIRDINAKEHFWRFNYSSHEETLVAGTARYSWPASTKVIDFDSFRIKKDDTLGVETRWLLPVTYDEYLKKLSHYEFDTSTTVRTVPRYVTSTPNTEYVVTPTPDEAYTLVFDTFTDPSDLSAYDDVPNIPERYRSAIIRGAMRDVYEFREDDFNNEKATAEFEKMIEDMRIKEINHYEYVRSGMRVRDHTGNATWQVGGEPIR